MRPNRIVPERSCSCASSSLAPPAGSAQLSSLSSSAPGIRSSAWPVQKPPRRQSPSMGADVLRGDLNDTDALRTGALDTDGIIHLAYEHPLGQIGGAPADAQAIDTCTTALAGSGKPLVVSGATLVRPGRPATEERRTGRRGAHRGPHHQHAGSSRRRDQRHPRLAGHAAPIRSWAGGAPRIHAATHQQGPTQGCLGLPAATEVPAGPLST